MTHRHQSVGCATCSQAGGFSLVEVTIALGLAAFGLLAIFGLLSTGLNTNRVSIDTTGAASLAAAVVADLQAAPRAGASPIYAIAPDTATSAELLLSQDGAKVTSQQQADYRARVLITTPSTGMKHVRVVMEWPAVTTNAPNNFEIVTVLDRF